MAIRNRKSPGQKMVSHRISLILLAQRYILLIYKERMLDHTDVQLVMDVVLPLVSPSLTLIVSDC